MGLFLPGSRKGVLLDKHGLLCSKTELKHVMRTRIMPLSKYFVNMSARVFNSFNFHDAQIYFLVHILKPHTFARASVRVHSHLEAQTHVLCHSLQEWVWDRTVIPSTFMTPEMGSSKS